MCQKSSSVSCKMLLVRPGMSESEQPVDMDIMDMCYSDLQRHGPKHIENLMREIFQGNENTIRMDCEGYTYRCITEGNVLH